MSEKIEIKSSRLKYWLLLLVGFGFVVTGVFLILRGQNAGAVQAGWMSVIFFGGCTIVFIMQLVERRPRLVIDDEGVLDRTLGVGKIPWEDIVHAEVNTINGQDFICLEVVDEQKYIGKMSVVGRSLVKANRALGFAAINLNLSQVDANPHQVCELILKKACGHRRIEEQP